MSFDHDQSWDKLIQIIDSGQTIKNAWSEFIDFHANIKSRPYWTALKTLDFEEEQGEIKEWIESVVTDQPLDADIISFWIGINKFTDGQSDKEFYAIYLVGCNSYNEDSIEWATDPTYLPEERYFVSKILNDIDEKIQADKKNYSFFDWILPLAYCSLMLTEIIKSKLNKRKFLNHQEKIFVTTGHDSGDYINLKAIEEM